MSVATLGFAIDSGPLAATSSELDKLTSSATKAEQAAAKVSGAGNRMSRGFADLNPALEKIVGSLSRLETTSTSIDKRLDAMSQAAGRAAKANTALDKSAIEASTAYKQLEASLHAVQAAQRKGDASLTASLASIQKQKDAIASLNAELQKLRSNSSSGGGGATGRKPANGNSQFNNANIAAQLFDIGSTAAFMNPATIALQQGPQLAQALGGQSIKGAIAGLGAGLASLVSPLSLAAIGLTAGAAAAIQFGISMATSSEETKKLDEVLADHEHVLDRLTKAYGSLVEGAKNYGRESQSLLGSVSRTNVTAITAARRQQASEFFDSVGYETAGNVRGKGSFFADTQFKPFESALTALRDGIKAGTADFDVFYRRVTAMGSASPELQKIGDEMIANASKVEDANNALKETLRLQNAIAAGQRGFLINSPGQDAANDYETQQRLALRAGRAAYDAQIAGLGARSPAEKAAAARAAERARVVAGESAEAAAQRVELAGRLALAQAERQLGDAQRDRAMNLDKILQDQQSEIGLIGRTGGAAAALRKEYELTSALRLEAARQGIEVDQKELDLIHERTQALGQLIDQYSQAKFNFDMGQQASDARLSPRERQIITTLRQYGLPEDLSGDNAAQIGQQLDWQDAKALAKGFGDAFGNELVSGSHNLGKAVLKGLESSLANEASKLWEKFFDGVGNLFADWLTGSKGGASGGGAIGSVAAALGGKVAANSNVAGGFSGLAPVIPVTRAPLGDISTYAKAIQSIESSGNYGALGPITRTGDRAYGAYQVMGSNIGPWSQEALGRTISAQEFLKNPSLQDQIFEKKFGSYVNQYGPSGAAQAWFGGPGSVGKGGMGADILGTTGSQYVDKFTNNVAKLTDATGSAASGLNVFGTGVGKLGSALGGAFPAAPAAGGGGGLMGLFGSLFFPNPASFSPQAASLAPSILGGSISGLFADGTNYAPGGMAIVGERGPELVNLPQGSQVFNVNKSAQMMGGGQGGISVDVRAYVDENGNWQAKVENISGRQAQNASRQNLAAYQKTQERGGFGRDQQTYMKRKG